MVALLSLCFLLAVSNAAQVMADAWKPWKVRSWKVMQHVHQGELERQWRRLEGHWRKRRQVHYDMSSAHSLETGTTRFPISTRALQVEEQSWERKEAVQDSLRPRAYRLASREPPVCKKTASEAKLKCASCEKAKHQAKREVETNEAEKAMVQHYTQRLEARLEAERVTRERLSQTLAAERVKSSRLTSEILEEQKTKLVCTRARAAEKIAQGTRRKIEEHMKQLQAQELYAAKGQANRLALELSAKRAQLSRQLTEKHDPVFANAKLIQESTRLKDQVARLSSQLFMEKVARATEEQRGRSLSYASTQKEARKKKRRRGSSSARGGDANKRKGNTVATTHAPLAQQRGLHQRERRAVGNVSLALPAAAAKQTNKSRGNDGSSSGSKTKHKRRTNETRFRLLQVAAFGLTIMAAYSRHLVCLQNERKKVFQLQNELQTRQAHSANMEQELMMVEDVHILPECPFDFTVTDEEINETNHRIVKVQCAGVCYRDVEIDIIPNGCIVSIHRSTPGGETGSTWTKRFQFSDRGGHFVFEEDHASLEHDYLQLVFRVQTPCKNTFRFPPHLRQSEGMDPEATARTPGSVRQLAELAPIHCLPRIEAAFLHNPETAHEMRGPNQSPLSNTHLSQSLDDVSEISSIALSEEFEMVEAIDSRLS